MSETFDLLIIGGGINGCGIARDAAGRGLSVVLCEKGDLAGATSSASTKLFHGGLRYLEYFEFRLVREALVERETLLRAMPHISWPMRFVLPYHKDMRFESDTPTSKLLSIFMPWMRGRRPAWLIRMGLFLYDHLGGRKILPGTSTLALTGTPEGEPLQDRFAKAYEYSDCWVEDSRLVVLNARDAEARGAQIHTRAEVISATAEDGVWEVTVKTGDGEKMLRAKMLVNASGPWVGDVIHGKLRLNSREKVRLVREALIERETLLRAMPHISWPMRFVLPWHADMRFENTTPTSRLLSRLMPWMRGRRPAWLIRLGLLLYDNLGGRKILPATSTLALTGTPEGAPLHARFAKAYEYSDCWVEDSRLVVLNARDAEARGAHILTRSEVVSASVEEGIWHVTVTTGADTQTLRAKMLVNAAGPWVGDIIHGKLRLNSRENVRLVRGSHIVTRALYDHDKCYFFQGTDGRIIFAIPYEQDFTLIGTTDAEHHDPATKPVCTKGERDYLCAFASQYFKRPVTAEDVVWSYSGVRPLYDDGASSATAATRDYTVKIDTSAGAPVLNIFGGKITTYRRLAEAALDKIGTVLPLAKDRWTAGVALPGGDFAHDGGPAMVAALQRVYPFLTPFWARRLVRAYGTEAREILGQARSAADLGHDFGATLTEAEVTWLMTREFARTAEDVLWRRSKLGLRVSEEQTLALDAWMHETARQFAPLGG